MGLGWLVDFLTSKVATWVVGLYRDKIITDLQLKYDNYITGLLDAYDLDDILEGRFLRWIEWLYLATFLIYCKKNPVIHER